MKKFLMSIMLFSLVLTGLVMPKNASAATEENDARVEKVEVTNVGKNEYINYGDGYRYRVYSQGNGGLTTFTGTAYDAQGNKAPAGTTFYIFFDAHIKPGKMDIKCVVGENGKFTGTASLPPAYGDKIASVGRFTHRYDIVDLYYYNEPGRTNSIKSNNLQSVYHFAFSI
ncbi:MULTISPECIES: hypothetical protein [Bacillus]|uniref:DUF4879 domain-containing protein n=3 Tax=Bacillus cereus group TaxID=86661 RepID=A0A5C4ZXQ6_9BACI|nr:MULTISPECIES: hypothetical protein [Bacillus]KZD36539.1 putative exported protein [Bacillus cereus]MCB4848584.1 hypothetical protein [Bacillus tropicus]MCU4759377.1 hypothetical protein [Bacillus cereus]MDF2016474.1 hypothetical protein [Bacillus sp. Cr_R3]MDF2033728.1 hypothetical protein [Bacillus sp. Cr_R16]